MAASENCAQVVNVLPPVPPKPSQSLICGLLHGQMSAVGRVSGQAMFR